MIRIYKLVLLSTLALTSTICTAQSTGSYPFAIRKLLAAYPQTLIGYSDSCLIVSDGSKIRYKESHTPKTHEALLREASIDDMFVYKYPKGGIADIARNNDPGRIRNDELFKKMYGSTAAQVQKNLTTIVWCPKLVNQRIRVTTANGVDKQLQKISDELDNHPRFKDYLQCSGTFLWRNVRGANRLSAHAFGTAIDISVKYSNYWQWDCRCNNENATLKYKNKIPQEIVDIFEKHGFIWGGKWYHYDTMHFEYRPDLLADEE